MVDRYIDTLLMCIDAKVAAALCVGGPCNYKLVEGSSVSENWLYDNVVPHILLHFRKRKVMSLERMLYHFFGHAWSPQWRIMYQQPSGRE